MFHKFTYKINPHELRGMRPEEREKYRQYAHEVAKRRFANYLLGGINFVPFQCDDQYIIQVILSSEDRYLNFKCKVRDLLKTEGVSYTTYDKLSQLFKEFETKDDENHYSTVSQSPPTT